MITSSLFLFYQTSFAEINLAEIRKSRNMPESSVPWTIPAVNPLPTVTPEISVIKPVESINSLLDVTGNVVVDDKDTGAILQYSAGLITDEDINTGKANFNKDKADINGDGVINAKDAIIFLNLKDKTADEALVDPKKKLLSKVNPELGLGLITQASEEAAIPNIKEVAGVKNQAGQDTMGAIVDTANKQGISVLDEVASPAVAAEVVIAAPVEPVVESIFIASQERVDEIVTDHPEAVNIETNNDPSGAKTGALWLVASLPAAQESKVKASQKTSEVTADLLNLIEIVSNKEDINNQQLTSTRQNAINSLGDFARNNNALAINYLLQVSNDKQDNVYMRFLAGTALAVAFSKINDPATQSRIVDALIGVLTKEGDDSDTRAMRSFAILYMPYLNTPQAVELLSKVLLSDVDPDIRCAVARALGEIGKTPTLEPSNKKAVVKYLIKALISEDRSITHSVCSALLDIGEPAVAELVKALSDASDYVADNVSSVLRAIGSSAVKPLLNELINGQNNNARSKAASLLGYLGTPEIIGSLIRIVNNKNDALYVRHAVVLALGEISCRNILSLSEKELLENSLITIIKDENQDWNLRELAIFDLGLLKDSQTVDLLADIFINDKDFNLQKAALDALITIGRPSLAALFNLYNDPDISYDKRIITAYGLSCLSEFIDSKEMKEKLVQIFIDILKEKDIASWYSIAMFSLHYLGALSIESLADLLDNNDAWIQRQAEIVLMGIIGELSPAAATKVLGYENPAVIGKIISYNEKSEELKSSIEKDFDVTIIDNIGLSFYLGELKEIKDILSTLSREVVSGLKIEKVKDSSTLGVYDSSIKTISLRSSLGDFTDLILIHEIGHYVDDKYFDFTAFQELYNKSRSSGDFADSSGETDCLEDFATTFESYVSNSGEEFLRALDESPVYLEKLLTIADVLTQGHPDYTLVYKNTQEGILVKAVNVERDQGGNIISLGGVDIYKIGKDDNGQENKTYNIQGLNIFFERLWL